MEPHDEFLELCALSTSGDLTEEEQGALQAHLSECYSCRQALKEFEATVDLGVPQLASKLAGTPTEQTELDREALAGPAPSVVSDSPRSPDATTGDAGRRTFAFAHRNGHEPTRVNWTFVWLPFAACLLLSAVLATYMYRVGRSRHSEPISDDSSMNASVGTEALEGKISDADHDRQVLKAQLGERDKVIADLRQEIDKQSSSLEQMKASQAKVEASIESDETDKQRVAEERTTVAQKLDAAQSSVQKMQAELELAQRDRSQGGTQDASLQAQIADLNRELRDREQTINKQEDLLSHDRDIRDLMGARDLYIAEVYDVGRDGATQKPFGRVFYTRGKSLVFYAYDLDKQPGVRDARTFQAWGRRGGDIQAAVSLGIFFEDNAAKKRWVVKFDDAKSLEQIDAVFVTVEPDGGSHKPSGKPLLFAYLKIEPNHP